MCRIWIVLCIIHSPWFYFGHVLEGFLDNSNIYYSFFTGTIVFAFILFLHYMTLKKMKKETMTMKQSSIKIHIDSEPDLLTLVAAGAFTDPQTLLWRNVLVVPLLLQLCRLHVIRVEFLDICIAVVCVDCATDMEPLPAGTDRSQWPGINSSQRLSIHFARGFFVFKTSPRPTNVEYC